MVKPARLPSPAVFDLHRSHSHTLSNTLSGTHTLLFPFTLPIRRSSSIDCTMNSATSPSPSCCPPQLLPAAATRRSSHGAARCCTRLSSDSSPRVRGWTPLLVSSCCRRRRESRCRRRRTTASRHRSRRNGRRSRRQNPSSGMAGIEALCCRAHVAWCTTRSTTSWSGCSFRFLGSMPARCGACRMGSDRLVGVPATLSRPDYESATSG